MGDNKPFSIVDIIMGSMLIGSIEGAESVLDPIGLGLLTLPAEIGVGTLVSLWFLYKGGSRMETRMFIWLGGTAIGLTPLGMFPDKIIAFLIGAHLANKSFEEDAKENKKKDDGGGKRTRKKSGGNTNDDTQDEEGDDESPEDDSDEESDETADDFDSWEEELGDTGENSDEDSDRELESVS
ncbi:MAG: hypothetical protein NUV96_01525 [Candidatus Colwellbacteria bacterium]|nr:hypothetical protein [Candidatus Colwellbacteria bacterium]